MEMLQLPATSCASCASWRSLDALQLGAAPHCGSFCQPINTVAGCKMLLLDVHAAAAAAAAAVVQQPRARAANQAFFQLRAPALQPSDTTQLHVRHPAQVLLQPINASHRARAGRFCCPSLSSRAATLAIAATPAIAHSISRIHIHQSSRKPSTLGTLRSDRVYCQT